MLWFTSFLLAMLPVDEVEIRQKVVEGWAVLDRQNQVFNATVSTVNVTFGGRERRSESRFAFQSALSKLEEEGRVQLINADGYFDLAKSADGAWQLKQTLPANAAVEGPDPGIAQYRTPAFSVSSQNLLVASQDPNFVFSDWREREDGFVVFRVLNKKEKSLNETGEPHPPAAFEAVEVVVDPANNSRIASFKQSIAKGELEAEVVAEYQYDLDPYYPSRVTTTSTRIRNGEPAGSRVLTWNATAISHTALPDSEFSLEHYGLATITETSESNLYPIALASVLLIAIVGLSIYYMRRTNS